MLTISPALPIKFFATGEQTFNETFVDGIVHKNYFHDLKCDEIQRLLGFEKSDGATKHYRLDVVKKGVVGVGDTIDFTEASAGVNASIPFVATSRTPDPFVNLWNAATKQVHVTPLLGTDFLDFAIVGGLADKDTVFYVPFSLGYIAGVGAPGPVQLHYYVYNSDMSLSAEIVGVVHTGPGGGFAETITFNVGFVPTFFSIRAEYVPNFLSDEEAILTIQNTLTITSSYYNNVTYSLDFIPSDFSLCGKCAVLRIVDKADGSIVYRTDPLNFKSSLYMSVAIQYKQSKSFAGIPYTEDTDYLTARFKGIFYKERPQEEQKVINLSNMTITSSMMLKKQKKLHVCVCPYYVMDQIKLILMHSAGGIVIINGIQLTKQEAFEYIEYADQYAWVAADCWINKKKYLYRDVLS